MVMMFIPTTYVVLLTFLRIVDNPKLNCKEEEKPDEK
jgi:hypothetical protein